MRSALALIFLAAAWSAVHAPAAPAAASCAREYGYAGVVGGRAASGVRARVTALGAALVRSGHVAAWVGVGSNAGGAGSWIQVGLAGFEGGGYVLYYEVGRSGRAPVYTPLRYGIHSSESHEVAVREVAGAPGRWRVWIDGVPVSPPIALAASHDAWKPMVMAESWNAGTGACNAFRFSFADLRTVASSGGGWTPLAGGPRLVDPGYRLVGNDVRLLAGSR
jgi:hypothetical protein